MQSRQWAVLFSAGAAAGLLGLAAAAKRAPAPVEPARAKIGFDLLSDAFAVFPNRDPERVVVEGDGGER